MLHSADDACIVSIKAPRCFSCCKPPNIPRFSLSYVDSVVMSPLLPASSAKAAAMTCVVVCAVVPFWQRGELRCAGIAVTAAMAPVASAATLHKQLQGVDLLP